MSNRYLARLRALNSEKGLPGQPSKPSKPSYEGFEGEQGMGFLKNQIISNSKKPISRQPSKPDSLQTLAEVELICAQCGGGPSTNPPTDAPTEKIILNDGAVILLHPECKAFRLRYLKSTQHQKERQP
jgi:hypothetical protein